MIASLAPAGAVITGVLAILLTLAPLGVSYDAWTSPQLLLAALAFWCLRRPAYAPPLLVFTLGLILDLARAGPVGLELFALLVVTEGLRVYTYRLPVFSLQAEALRVAAAVTGFELICFGLMTAFFAEGPSLGVIALRWLLTLIAYFALARLQQAVFGVRRGDEAAGGYLT